MSLVIESAEKIRLFARIALWGVEKSGKTHYGLELATALAGEGGKVGVISSEHCSSRLLSRRFPHQIVDLAKRDRNGKMPPNAFAPQRYEAALKLLLQEGYQAIMIDSLTHAWAGSGGVLEIVGKKGFTDGWGEGTPAYNDLVNALLAAPCHIIVTLRAKEAYELEPYTKKDNTQGLMPKNVGLAPIMRKGFAYEMQLIIRMSDHNATIQASGVEDFIPRGEELEKPGPELAYRLLEALDGAEPPVPLPTKQELYEQGKAKGLWTKPDAFYAKAAEMLGGVAVSARTWEQLTREQLLLLEQTIEMEDELVAEGTA